MVYGEHVGIKPPSIRIRIMTIVPTPTTAFATLVQGLTRRHLLLQYRLTLLAGSAWGLVARTGAKVQERGVRGLDQACQGLEQLEQDLAWSGLDAAALPGQPERLLPDRHQ